MFASLEPSAKKFIFQGEVTKPYWQLIGLSVKPMKNWTRKATTVGRLLNLIIILGNNEYKQLTAVL